MKSTIVFIAAFTLLPFFTPAQTITEADIPVIKEMQTTILDLMVRAVSNYDDLRGAEILKRDDITMFTATAIPGIMPSGI